MKRYFITLRSGQILEYKIENGNMYKALFTAYHEFSDSLDIVKIEEVKL